MLGIKALIGDLVATAESPLYSTMCWVDKQLGHSVGTRCLLAIIDELVQDERVRLWEVDASGDRTELFVVPKGLADRYESLHHTDQSYDPLSLSLTIGILSEAQPDPAWDVDIDMQHQVFALRTIDDAEAENDALNQLRILFPLTDFDIEGRRQDRGAVYLVGSAIPKV